MLVYPSVRVFFLSKKLPAISPLKPGQVYPRIQAVWGPQQTRSPGVKLVVNNPSIRPDFNSIWLIGELIGYIGEL